MKKRTLGAGVLTAMMMFSPIAVGSTDASTQTTQQATQKVMWGKNELTQTQNRRNFAIPVETCTKESVKVLPDIGFFD